MIRSFIRNVFIFGTMLALAGCSGPDAKKAKFFAKGKELLEKGDLVKAKLEFKNAIQIDPKYADAYRMIRRRALAAGAVRGQLRRRGGPHRGATGSDTDMSTTAVLPPADAPVRVLAIDDEAFQLKLLTRQFARLGIDVIAYLI